MNEAFLGSVWKRRVCQTRAQQIPAAVWASQERLSYTSRHGIHYIIIRRSHRGEDREKGIQKFGVPDRSTADPDCQSRCVWRIAVLRGNLFDSQRRELDSWDPLGLKHVRHGKGPGTRVARCVKKAKILSSNAASDAKNPKC